MSADQRSRNNVFAGLALDRCSERRLDLDWLRDVEGAAQARFLVVGPDGKALSHAEGRGLRLLDGGERAELLSDLAPTLLGVDPEQNPYFLLTPDHEACSRAGERCAGHFLDLRRAGIAMPAFEAGLFAYARGLAHWQSRSRWCGACGSALSLEWAGHRARCTNKACGIEHFPRTDPAIIVIVTWRDACLLGRQSSWPQGRYSTLAGFVEPGETLEDAVRREVFEEAGVRVVDSDYHSSQPWPFPSSLMLGFTARADDPRIQVGDEIDEARWFEVDEFVHDVESGALGLPPPLSVSYRLIEHWLKQAGGLELGALKSPATWT
ncbi:NAD(+) diphosphatase [Dokdonella sp.]|uniref:NAD(+) diphosphatase n=1 Tax=Dokdonella sp. TaxID=2291710 RepID=UPI00352743C4